MFSNHRKKGQDLQFFFICICTASLMKRKEKNLKYDYEHDHSSLIFILYIASFFVFTYIYVCVSIILNFFSSYCIFQEKENIHRQSPVKFLKASSLSDCVCIYANNRITYVVNLFFSFSLYSV